ncbi:hypothetical protein C0989_010004 [Termitomyces sp. Mn162]|nr:hypothetical protein C0989_010004 [Termitomyces sp. Mn162]
MSESMLTPPHSFLNDSSRKWTLQLNVVEILAAMFLALVEGQNLVESSIWLLIASMVATLDIAKAVDASGNPVEPRVHFNNPIFRSVGPPSNFLDEMNFS